MGLADVVASAVPGWYALSCATLPSDHHSCVSVTACPLQEKPMLQNVLRDALLHALQAPVQAVGSQLQLCEQSGIKMLKTWSEVPDT